MSTKQETAQLIYKLVVMGDQYCGKSSIINRYIDGKYSPTYLQTIGTDFWIRKIKVAGNPVKLHIHDTMGQSDMKTITKSLYRNAQGIILVFDFSRVKTLDHIKDWIDLIHENCDTIPEIFLVGNKVDLYVENRVVTSKQAQRVAESHNLPLTEVSAKTDFNIDAIFQHIAEAIHRNRKQLFPESVTTSIRLDNSNKERKKCCKS